MTPRILLLTMGEASGAAAHPWRDTQPRLRAILPTAEMLMDAAAVERLNQDRPPLTDCEAIVLHGLYGRDEDAEQALERFVHAGRGLVIVHIASNSFEGSPRFRRLAGRVWEYGDLHDGRFTSHHPPAGSFRVEIVDPDHPVTHGLASFDIEHDERYEDLLVSPETPIHVLATATVDGRTEPVAWSVEPARGGRVFHITLGHGGSTYDNPGFRALLTRGVAWAAQRDVEDFQPA